ncbi:Pyrophosphatase PpaX [Tritonibacter multivorans]|uniref:Pyrophosphatase PpaX n=1 Tax=Tritonibacter multivorans TaxID=928856 RepID=A0A0P1GSC4_9RHOB|nr:HAD-IA family hydrolase [Tritonibacter multivorans]MDA7421213.1 HAD-IA family hydrolase [Tritonibacter multivorans]CUH77495.1 Pyrophosphatase PpaX [Tritonibacter multivorans]SFD32964.1 phosphoglycolate phosphatase [Tritonibacter multivorans]
MTGTPLKLVLFDVDGTLVDSQGTIVACMAQAFAAEGVIAPTREEILSIVGLSLPQALAQLAPAQSEAVQAQIVEGYKIAYKATRERMGPDHSPLYPGARACLEALHSVPEFLLGVATGKSQRGLDGLIDGHGLHMFVTRQVADHHPSKPHPSMVLTALTETGVQPEHCVMIGDTTFDMQMGRAAGVTTIGVDWGYHPSGRLDGDYLISDYSALLPLLNDIWKD